MKATNSKNNATINTLLMLPLIFVLGFAPLIMRVYQYDSGLSAMEWFPNASTSQIDIFLAWKSFVLTACGVIMLGLILVKTYRDNKISIEKWHAAMWIYGAFVLISGIFSLNRSFSFGGSFERFEPVFVILSYLIFCWYGYIFATDEKSVKILLYGAAIGMAILLGIGIFQGFKLDLFKTDFGRFLITTKEFRKVNGQLSVTMEPGRAYTTLYNPDFSSMYAAVLFPVACALCLSAKKWWGKVIFGVLAVAFIVELRMAWVTSGFLGLLGGLVLAAFVLLSRKKKPFIIALIGFAVVVIVVMAAFGGKILKRVGWDRTYEGKVATYAEDDTEKTNPIYVDFVISQIETLDDGVVFHTKDGRETKISWEYTSDGVYPNVTDEALFNELDGSFALGQYSEGTYYVQISINGRMWNFIRLEDGYYYLNGAGKFVKMHDVPKSDLLPDGLMSGRGNIWNHTFPILTKYIFKGSGADTYILAYPQDDYLRSDMDTTYDVKPHSFYLQQWVEHGFLGFAALMVFFGWYVVTSIRIYRRANLKEPLVIIGFGCFTGVLCDLVTFLANDSNTCTSCVFWCILGIGVGVNRALREKVK